MNRFPGEDAQRERMRREDRFAPGPVALLKRIAVGAVTLVLLVGLLAFAWVLLLVVSAGALLVVLAVRVAAARARMPWRLWLMRFWLRRRHPAKHPDAAGFPFGTPNDSGGAPASFAEFTARAPGAPPPAMIDGEFQVVPEEAASHREP